MDVIRSMKLWSKIVLAMCLLWVGGIVQAQEEEVRVSASEGAELMTRRYADAYDSLLNSYYMRRYAHRNLHSTMQFSVEEFDALPDSILERRLRALPTVFPLSYNDIVRSYIRFYLKHMSTRLEVMLTLQEFYFPMFEDVLDRYGLPDDLKYLSIVESAMNPQATSRVGAAGLWQFMYSTGKLYDLEVNSVVDDRRDPYKSTVAAARHLRDLYGIFGDWQLAMAAYNCGTGNVNKAIARSGGHGFWEIYYSLPRETRGYVPAFIAVEYVMNYYSEHGLKPSKLEIPIRCDTVIPSRDVLLCYVAEATGVEMDELRTLNPQYRVGYLPGAMGNHALCLPIDKLEAFIAMQDSIYAHSADSLERKPIKVMPHGKAKGRSAATGNKYYTVRKGDTLYKVASKHGISVAKLKSLNGLKGDSIRVGQKLKVR